MSMITKTTINHNSIKINITQRVFNYKDHIILMDKWTSWQGKTLNATGKHQTLIPFRMVDTSNNHFKDIMIMFQKSLKSLDYENSK